MNRAIGVDGEIEVYGIVGGERVAVSVVGRINIAILIATACMGWFLPSMHSLVETVQHLVTPIGVLEVSLQNAFSANVLLGCTYNCRIS